MTNEQREAIDRLSSLLKKGKYGVAGKTLLYEDYYMLKNVLEVVENQEQKIIKQLEENKKKDKQIDLMAEWISERCFYKDDYSNSCEIMQDSCSKEDDCKHCIKQYFERKAEDEK
ncbi:MAG: hypothetical protein ACLR6T_01975 [Intestinibacter sp.]